jgi:subtilisin family serine protease
MKFSGLSLLGALLGGASLAHGAPAPSGSDYAPGEVLVKVAPSGAASVRGFLTRSGARSLRSFPSTGWQRIQLPSNTNVSAAIERYKTVPGVVAVEPNFRIKALRTPSEPRFEELFALSRINAPAAWDVNTGSEDIVVAVADTGVKYNHPDLAPNMWRNPGEIEDNGKDDDSNGIVDDVYGYDSFNSDGDPMDDNGHGTHCAGTIGAVADGKGVVGVNWRVKIMALKFLGESGFSFSDGALEAYEYAIAQKKRGVNLRVISNSWGSLNASLAMQSALKEAAENGIISICAAGNETTNNDRKPTFPTNYDVPGLVAVGATDENDKIADFSNYGRNTVDLFAPGVNILSTSIGKGGAAYSHQDGTSMACPHVAGAAALLLAQVPSLGVEELKERLLKAVDKLPQLRSQAVSGGRLNLAKLLSGGIYSVKGRVLSDVKKPIAGVQVSLAGSDKKVTTDASGTYAFDGLVPGTYSASATLKGWKFVGVPTQVALGQTATAKPSYIGKIDFQGTPTTTLYSFSGSVYLLENDQKRPLAGASIFLGENKTPVATTDSKGRYTVTGRAKGTYFVSAKTGNYDLRAVGQLTLDGSGKVVLPARDGSPVTLDFAARLLDISPPVVTVRSPSFFNEYGLGQPGRAFGTAYDPSGVAYIDFVISRVVPGGQQFYLWEDKVWSDVIGVDPEEGYTIIPEKGFLPQVFNSTSVDWSVDLPELEAGNYSFAHFASDTLGNAVMFSFGIPFSVIEEQSNTDYPRVTITQPAPGQAVVAGTILTAKGKATDEEGVDEVYVYLRRYDERGRILGYYNWTEKTWVSNNFDSGVYAVLDGKNQKSVAWSQKLPALVPGNYELGALGRDRFGNEPSENGSEDSLSSFSVQSGVEASQKAAPASGGTS